MDMIIAREFASHMPPVSLVDTIDNTWQLERSPIANTVLIVCFDALVTRFDALVTRFDLTTSGEDDAFKVVRKRLGIDAATAIHELWMATTNANA